MSLAVKRNQFVYSVLNKSAAVPSYHRVDRVLGFSPVVHVGTPPPSPAGECIPPPFGWGVGGQPRLRERGLGGGGSQFRRGDRQRGTLGI